MKAGINGPRSRKLVDVFVDYWKLLLFLVILITLIMAFFVPNLEVDASGASAISTSSNDFLQYQKFLKTFGNEEFLLVAIHTATGAGDSGMLEALKGTTVEFANYDKIEQVVSLANFNFLQRRADKVGNFPILRTVGGALQLPEPPELAGMRSALPLLDLLVSRDLKTLGILVRVREEWRLDMPVNDEIVSVLHKTVKSHFPADVDTRIVGPQMIRMANWKGAIQTSIIFGVLCTLICAGVSAYVFKDVKITVLAVGILGICVFWVAGMMAIFKIRVTATTSTSFGLILITTLEIVIHSFIRYSQFHILTQDKMDAVREMVRFLARPCLFCFGTTAVGFGALMVSTIPMIFQLGLAMSIGLMMAYLLAMILAPSFIIMSRSVDVQLHSRPSSDLFGRSIEKMKTAIANHHTFFVAAGIAFSVLMFAGTPLIRSDAQFLRLLGESSPAVQDIRFVQSHLGSFQSVELMLEASEGTFRDPAALKKVMELEQGLREVPDVTATESLLSVLEYANQVVVGDAANPQDLFTKAGLVPQLLLMIGMGSDGEELIRGFVDEDFGKMRLSVRIKNSPDVPLGSTIDGILTKADAVMKGLATPFATGELVVMERQGQELINSQFESMLIAIVIIAVLMMIQMGTPLFGLVSLVPNIPPVAAVFGIMGWFGITLDFITIFAATVAVGLAVDNTIQYVTQLKREMHLNPNLGVEQCVLKAYTLAAKPMASWSIVTMLGFLALAATPYKGATYFGILVASAVAMGMFGDLVFMQSFILTSRWVRNLIRRLIVKESDAQKHRGG